MKNAFVLTAGVVCSLVLSIWALVNSFNGKGLEQQHNKVAYVELGKVFNEFEMKQELEKDLEKDISFKQSILDSLMFELQQMNTLLQSKESPDKEEILKFQRLQQYYMDQKQVVDDYAAAQTEKFDQQILTQMQTYIDDFGKQNGYKIILGSNNNGVVLYGNELSDITTPVIEFINLSYQGKN